jgi:integrase
MRRAIGPLPPSAGVNGPPSRALSILPLSCDHAALLTEADVATLQHLAQQGMGANSLRAISSDLAYLEGWCQAATLAPLSWPASEGLVLKFVAHHLYDHAENLADNQHGMPEFVKAELRQMGLLVSDGPHAPSTVRRRLASWATLHRWRGLPAPFGSITLRSALKLAVRASMRPRHRKSERAITKDILRLILATCDGMALIDLRDRALLSVAFASGGRRRSEMANLRMDRLEDYSEPWGSDGRPAMSIRLGRTKTTSDSDFQQVWIVGEPVLLLREWLAASHISKGFVFRAINRWGQVSAQPLSPQSINLLMKRRVAAAGFNPAKFSAHGLRSGFLTEASLQGVPLIEAMQQSQHRSMQQAAQYYQDGERQQSRAARLMD